MNRMELLPRRSSLVVGLFVCLAVGCSHPKNDPAPMSAQALDMTVKTAGGRAAEIGGSETGVGWSIAPKTEVAVSEALSHAGVHDKTDLLVVFYTAQHPADEVLSSIRARQGDAQR